MTRTRPGWFFLSLRLNQPQRSTLEALAKQRNVTLSEVIRSLIEEAQPTIQKGKGSDGHDQGS